MNPHIAALQKVVAIAECLRDLGRPIPSGELYAHVMNYFTLEEYNGVIESLVKSKLVKQESFLLTWIGPRKES